MHPRPRSGGAFSLQARNLAGQKVEQRSERARVSVLASRENGVERAGERKSKGEELDGKESGKEKTRKEVRARVTCLTRLLCEAARNEKASAAQDESLDELRRRAHASSRGGKSGITRSKWDKFCRWKNMMLHNPLMRSMFGFERSQRWRICTERGGGRKKTLSIEFREPQLQFRTQKSWSAQR